MTMSEHLAAALRGLGNGFNLPQTQALIQPLQAGQPREGVRRTTDLAYGDHERHRLDVYQPEAPGQGRPVVLFVHGGGFVRGDKAMRENVGLYLARHGCVAVLPSYRLAPASRWPSGPQDVAAAVRWVAAQAAAYGGDPQRLVLVGESAGAAHVAAATLITRFGLVAGRDFRAAVLLSGSYDPVLEGRSRAAFGIETPDPRNESYFGPTPDDWAAGCLVDQVDAAGFPLLISFTERDLLQMQVQAGQLFARLVRDLGFMPELRCVADHNHFSQTMAINTVADTVGPMLLEYVARRA